MRKFLFSLFLFSSFGVFAQDTIMCEIFKQMPDSIVPYMTANNRLDFIDFINSNMKAEVTNMLGGKSKLSKLTYKYMHLQLNEAASIEMRLLPVKKAVDGSDQIICMIRNYGKDIRDCSMDFYSLKWKRLNPKVYFDYPLGSKMFVAKLDENEPVLTLIPGYQLDTPANEEQETIALPSIKFKWEGRFVNYN